MVRETEKHSKVNQKDFWEERYITKHMPWDIGQVAPAFVKYLQSTKYEVQSANLGTHTSVAVLGCGHGHDAFYFAGEVAQPRFQVFGFDFSESAIKYCNKVKKKENLTNIDFYQIDFFELIKDNKWKNYFDFVIEHTSLAAIDPKRRIEYINLIKYLLKPGGKLIGLFFIKPKELSGPPYGIKVEEVRELLKENFIEIEKLHYEECLHSEKLQGEEWFAIFQKK